MRSSRTSRITQIELVVAWLTAVLALVTVFWPDWIELALRFDPDHRSGAAEWIVVICLLAVSAMLFVAAGRRSTREMAKAPSA